MAIRCGEQKIKWDSTWDRPFDDCHRPTPCILFHSFIFKGTHWSRDLHPLFTHEKTQIQRSYGTCRKPQSCEVKGQGFQGVCLILEFVGFIMSCLPCWREGGDLGEEQASLRFSAGHRTFSGAAWATGPHFCGSQWLQPTGALSFLL